MKKQVTILLSVAILFFTLSEASFAQKASTASKQKSEQEELTKQAKKAKEAAAEVARVEELYKAKMIDATSRRAELKAIEESRTRDFFEYSPDFQIAYTDGAYGVGFISGSQNSETLEFRKSVKESSFVKEVPFDIDEESNKASIAVSGSCKDGEIRIKIVKPGGSTYTEVLIDEYGSVNWNKSFTMDEESNGKSGEWKFIITAKEATGNFKLSIKSY